MEIILKGLMSSIKYYQDSRTIFVPNKCKEGEKRRSNNNNNFWPMQSLEHLKKGKKFQMFSFSGKKFQMFRKKLNLKYHISIEMITQLHKLGDGDT